MALTTDELLIAVTTVYDIEPGGARQFGVFRSIEAGDRNGRNTPGSLL